MTVRPDWPYADADPDDPLTVLRIPVTSAHPHFTYTACFDRDSWVRPTDAEARMIVSFIEEYQQHHFGDGSWRKRQQAKPFDMDCRTTTIFHKWGEDDWSYRISTWRDEAEWIPDFPHRRGGEYDGAKLPAMSLEQVMDRAHARGAGQPSKRWLEWKANHPGLFGDVAACTLAADGVGGEQTLLEMYLAERDRGRALLGAPPLWHFAGKAIWGRMPADDAARQFAALVEHVANGLEDATGLRGISRAVLFHFERCVDDPRAGQHMAMLEMSCGLLDAARYYASYARAYADQVRHLGFDVAASTLSDRMTET